MSFLFSILVLVSFAGLIVGLLKPQLVIRWGKKKKRSQVFLIYGGALFVFFVLVGITTPTTKQKKEKVVSSEGTKKSVPEFQKARVESTKQVGITQTKRSENKTNTQVETPKPAIKQEKEKAIYGEGIKKSVLDFQKKIEQLEQQYQPIFLSYQTTMEKLGKKQATIYDAYSAAKQAEGAAKQLLSNYRSITIPDGLPDDIEKMLKEALEEIKAGYYVKMKMFSSVLKFLDEGKPKYMEEIKESADQFQLFLMRYSAKITQANLKVGNIQKSVSQSDKRSDNAKNLSNKSNSKLNKILSITDFPYTISGEQAVSLTFGGDNENYLDVTIKRVNVYQGYKVTSKRKSNSNAISATANWNSNTYVESSKHDTVISFCIETLDEKDRIAEITVFAKLVDTGSFTEFLNISKAHINVAGENFGKLTKKME